MPPIVIALVLAAAGGTLVRRRRRPPPARAVILSPRKSTDVAADGAVRSMQSAEFSLPEADLDRLWTPDNLENLARTYWRFLSRVTLGVIRVIYGPEERRVALVIPQLTLLRFEAPRYSLEPGHGSVCWRIRDGLLVARGGRGSGYLKIDAYRSRAGVVTHELAGGNGHAPGRGHGTWASAPNVRIEIEVANFYPAIASRLSLPVYMGTQSWIHVIVTHGFLRSLARLNLAQSRIGSLADAMRGAVSARGVAASGAAGSPAARQP